MISVQSVIYTYGPAKDLIFPDWEIEQGKHSLILGGSGCGKTTLLHVLAGLRTPTAGIVKVAGQVLSELGGHRMDVFRGKHIGLIFQKPHLLSVLTVEDNLLLAQYMAELPQDKKRIRDVLDVLNLSDRRNAKVYELSQGEAQRIAIARAVLNKPQVILADEPTASLDDDNSEKVLNILEEQANVYNATLVIATHDQRVKSRFPHQLKL
ncbi:MULTISPECIES: ABC transporter ATP-binding protein [unclassified Imperialibacter]|uniref:ABC transporter ATP-binding protein n=1 Tax=unclassified Imperialibacter TaxID=2629706 RepID=UPI0012538BA1|nr:MULTISPECIES: ATP-binding cassette domain-containing protein [unclassified Imperialibacter]CAD5273643.1 ABC transporter ATP-binding protein [Imperialibacter sp. 89]CAD5289298.1 ABC transporter ATP-binding protein [Imperialibacter sp. 75]VVT13972.1 ABC transporter ATP-binding protein [Imperialibacter sp. EC-SDR9]